MFGLSTSLSSKTKTKTNIKIVKTKANIKKRINENEHQKKQKQKRTLKKKIKTKTNIKKTKMVRDPSGTAKKLIKACSGILQEWAPEYGHLAAGLFCRVHCKKSSFLIAHNYGTFKQFIIIALLNRDLNDVLRLERQRK